VASEGAPVKIGFCMLLWTTHVTEKDRPILETLKATGYDGVEIPVFEGTPDHYAGLAKMLDAIGLDRTAITVVPTLDKNPLSEDAAVRKAAVDYLKYCVDCTAALGARQVAGPVTQTLGHFSGTAPTAGERSRARGVHRKVGDYAARNGLKLVVEAVNRFETYFVNTMDGLAAYLDFVDHPAVTGMYDTFHANIEELDPVGAFTRNKRHLSYVHISENDRGVPGRGHVPWKETFRAIKRSGYDGWLTIEAFGRGLPELAAATRVWRDFSEGPEAVYREGFKTIRNGWKKA
jgi:D-psicose/D-tagatose/L-ribulose 3-epimerase